MGSDRMRPTGPPLRHLGILNLLLLAVACPMPEVDPSNGVPDDRTLEEIVAEDRPPRAFFGGTSLIGLTRPDRCGHVQGPLDDITFRWEPSGEVRVYVAVMRAEPVGTHQQLANPEDVVWVWTTAGDRSDSGFVTWAEGFAPDPQGLPTDDPPSILGPGVHRLWLVSWAWDERRELSHSSEIRPFFYAPDADRETVCCDSSPYTDPADTEAAERWYDYWCRPQVPLDEADEHPAHATRFGCADRAELCAE